MSGSDYKVHASGSVDGWDVDQKVEIEDIILCFCPRVTDESIQEFGLFCTNEAESPVVKSAFCLFSWYKMCLEIIKLSTRKRLEPHVQINTAKRMKSCCSKIKHYNEKLRKYAKSCDDDGQRTNYPKYLEYFRDSARQWRVRHQKYRQEWEKEALQAENIAMLLKYAKLRGPGGKLLLAISESHPDLPKIRMQISTYISAQKEIAQTRPAVIVRKFYQTEWKPEETKIFINIMLQEKIKYFDAQGRSIRPGFYKYIEETYVIEKKMLHPSRNSSTIRSYWGNVCRTIRDEKYREAAVALYQLDDETVNEIITMPVEQIPSKGKECDSTRIRAVVRKFKEMNPGNELLATTEGEGAGVVNQGKMRRIPTIGMNL